MDYENSGESGELTSKYNSAVAQIMRLSNLWQQAQYYATNGQLSKWNWILDAISRDLSVNMTGDEKKKLRVINEKLCETRDRNKIYQILSLKEVVIKKIEDSQGKGSAYKSSDDDDI